MHDRGRVIKGVVWIVGALCTCGVLAVIGWARGEIAPWGGAPFTTHHTDPTGDAFGVSPQHDVTDVLLTTDGVTLTVAVAFDGPVDPYGSGINQVAGYLDFDTDQDVSTGRTTHLADCSSCTGYSALGVDYYIDLSTFS